MSVINKNLSLQNVPISANLEGERSKEDENNNYWHAAQSKNITNFN